jgi:hypothetical protein
MTVANGTFTSVSTSSQNGVVPYMISPIGVGQGLDVGTSTGLELSIAIARNSINKTGQIFTHPTISSCRFYAAMYDMTPAAEQMYLSKLPTKVIKYDDFLSFQSLNIPPNGNFNQILTNSIARGRKLIGVPVLTENYAGAAGTISPLASPFSTSPCTTARNAITNFNVLISGSNLYQSNLSYTSSSRTNFVRKVLTAEVLLECLPVSLVRPISKMATGSSSQIYHAQVGNRFIISAAQYKLLGLTQGTSPLVSIGFLCLRERSRWIYKLVVLLHRFLWEISSDLNLFRHIYTQDNVRNHQRVLNFGAEE